MVLVQPPFHHTENALGLGKYFKARRKYFMHIYQSVLDFSDWKIRRISFFHELLGVKVYISRADKAKKNRDCNYNFMREDFVPYVYQTMNCPLIFTTKVLDWNPSETALILTRSCVFKSYSRPFADAKNPICRFHSILQYFLFLCLLQENNFTKFLIRHPMSDIRQIKFWFTHETEKDKTGNVILGVTKLGKTKLGIWFAENLFCEIPTFMANSKISKYEKFKN